MLLLRKILTLLFISSLSFMANAGHGAYGGKIYWECANGKYVFYFTKYAECSGLQISYSNTTLNISGSPLPKNNLNNSVSSLVLKPDSTKWNQQSQGDTHPQCSQGSPQITCGGNAVAVKQYFYKTDSIALFGSPPSGGWRFYVHANDQRAYSNLASNGLAVYASHMYPNLLNSNASSCYENPPKFTEFPQFHYCRGSFVETSFSGIDIEGDSLVYELNSVFESNTNANYASGFSPSSPLPSKVQDTSNRPVIYDPNTGALSFRVNSGFGSSYYIVNYSIDSYRNGNLISSVRHEAPALIISCPDLPNQVENTAPIIQPPFNHGANLSSFKDTVRAGSPVLINLSVRDTNTYNGQFQNIQIEIFGDRVSKDLLDSRACYQNNDTTCAIVFGVPQYDSSRATYYYSALGVWNNSISWQTDCNDLDPNGTAKTHYFYVRAKDDFCPIPGEQTKVVAITVLPDTVVCPNLSTSITQAAEKSLNELRLYPNPTSGLVFIDREFASSLEYQIFNIQGKLMKIGSLGVNQNQLELPDAEGLFFVSFRDEEGNERTFKLIKQ